MYRIICLFFVLIISNQALSNEPPEYICGLDFDGDGSFSTEGETSFCDPTSTINTWSCPLGRVECTEIKVPVSDCISVEQKLLDEQALELSYLTLDLTNAQNAYNSLIANRENINAQIILLNDDISNLTWEIDSLEWDIWSFINEEVDRFNQEELNEMEWELSDLQEARTLAINNRVGFENDLISNAQLITESSTTINNIEFSINNPPPLDITELQYRQSYCPINGGYYSANDMLDEVGVALRDKSCALDCNGSLDNIERTVIYSPVVNGTCLNVIDADIYVDPTTNTVDYVAAELAEINLEVSPQNCYKKEIIISETADTDFIEDTPLTTTEDTAQCTGDIQIFSGSTANCRTVGYQTRFDNCCNNGDKIISDSFSEKGVVEQAADIATMVSDMLDGALGSGVGADVANLISDGFSKLGLDPTGLAGKVGNWLITPCSKDSMNVSMMASDMCQYVGTRCIEKWEFVGCVQHAQVHCCFKTKLAALFHKQAREQLYDMGWGTAQEPNCEGFTPEEFQTIDFSRIDLSDYVDDVEHKPVDDIQDDLMNSVNDLNLPTN